MEQGLHGLGKVFAASTDDLMSEAAELLALRGSGFTWRSLWKRSIILVPVFIFATYLAFSSEDFVKKENYFTAGLYFGISAVALSLTTAIQNNGWFLALLGSTEGLVAGLTVLTARKINNFIYRRKLRSAIGGF